MVERIRDLIERFPEDERSIRELIESDSAFVALCQEYKDSTDEIRRFESLGGSSGGSIANWLKQRCCCLEEEILAKIEGYRPV